MQGDIFHADYYFNLCHKKIRRKINISRYCCFAKIKSLREIATYSLQLPKRYLRLGNHLETSLKNHIIYN